MSWIKRRPLLALAVLAFSLRASCALLTEYNPIFPSYYYIDASLTHVSASGALDAVRAGREPEITGTLSERIQKWTTIGTYRVFGARPLAMKLLNALLGAAAVAALASGLALVFPVQIALAAGGLVAVWPSHVFYTSQNLKEAPIHLLAFLALGGALAAGFGAASRPRAAAFALGAALSLVGVGFYRPSVMASLTAALLLALCLAASEPKVRANAAVAAAFLIAALAIFPGASRSALHFFDPPGTPIADSRHLQSTLIPAIHDEVRSDVVYKPTSPEGISRFRKARQTADRRWAKFQSGDNRDIGTQIYPDDEFKSWGDILRYLPKGAFSVLFMPLPGLYPLDGKLGRWAAAGENLLLLSLSALAALGLVRGPRAPARFGLIVFFAAMTAGGAMLEFDLGSAARHKLLYLPMLFPFAVEEAARLAGFKRAS